MKIPKHYDRCATCDEWWDTHDPEAAKVHLHPEPQSGPPRDAWLKSRLPYERWIAETPEGMAWLESKNIKDCTTTRYPKSTSYHGTENHLHYEEIRNAIENLPDTWCPALLFALVRTCVRKHVFSEGGLISIVQRAIAEEKMENEI